MTRRSELDWVRSAAMLSVLLIHVSSTFVSRPSQLSLLGVTPAFFCNQAARFAVPLFFMLSGLSLGLSRRPVKLPDFWLRRLRRVGLPYLLWTVFYFLLNRGFRLSLEPGLLRALGRDLLLGSASSHLWFISTLLQLYLLYPLLRLLQARFPRLTLGFGLLLSLFCTLIIYVPLPLRGWWRPYLWLLFPTWLGFFLLGMALGEERLRRLTDFCFRRRTLLLLLGLAAALLYAWDARRSGNLDSIKPQLFVYAPLCFAALCAAWPALKRLPGAEKAAAFLAARSMGVYFCHVFLLTLLRRVSFLTANTAGMLLLFAATLLLSLALVFLWEKLCSLLRRH